MSIFSPNSTSISLLERIEKLEKKVKTLKKAKSTLSQKMLILEHFQVLDKISQLNISSGNKIKILAYLLEAHEKSIEPNFNGRGKQLDSKLSTEVNYKFLVTFFTEIGLPGEVEKAQIQLQKIQNRKKSKKGVTP